MQNKEQKKEFFDEIVISDTCCLISFEQINKLDLLKYLYNNICITPDVLNEYERGGSKIPSFIKVKDVENKNEISKLLNSGLKLHLGEASSIVLCKESKNALLLTDDSRARKYADANNIKYATTLDILIEGRETGYIKSNQELHNDLDNLKKANSWISDDLINNIKIKYKIEKQEIVVENNTTITENNKKTENINSNKKSTQSEIKAQNNIANNVILFKIINDITIKKEEILTENILTNYMKAIFTLAKNDINNAKELLKNYENTPKEFIEKLEIQIKKNQENLDNGNKGGGRK